MKDCIKSKWICALALLVLTPLAGTANIPGGGTGTGANVTLTSTGTMATMSNGIVQIVCSISGASLTQINYTYNNGSGTTTTQLLAGGKDGGEFYWETGGFGSGTFTYSVVVNPSTNGGNYAEIDLLSTSATNGVMDVHFSMLRGSPGFYVTGIWSHRNGDVAMGTGEERDNIYLNPTFAWNSIDATRNFQYNNGGTAVPVFGAPQEVTLWTSGYRQGLYEDKYKYSAIFGTERAWGWSSVTNSTAGYTGLNIGIWHVLASSEFYNGGPMKPELMDAPMVNMINGGHYEMGSDSNFAANEVWTRVSGPYFIYCNNVSNTITNPSQAANALFADAQAQATAEATAWPYSWFSNSNYTQASGRGTVTGTFVISDSGNPNASAANLWIGVVQQPSTTDGVYDFQQWEKPYQFWVKSDANGNFSIPNVIAGTNYTLYAFGAGANGTFMSQTQTGGNPPISYNLPATPFAVTVTGGATTSLGTITWTPTRVAPTVFEIGYPDRTGSKFRHGEDWWVGDIGPSPTSPSPVWSKFLEYPFDFPSGPNYVVGTSQWPTGWNFIQPVVTSSTGAYNNSSSNITFNLASNPANGAQASLYLGLASDDSAAIIVTVNGTNLGSASGVTATPNAIPTTGYYASYASSDTSIREGINAAFSDERLTFPASLLHSGANTINLSIRQVGGSYFADHAMYDYLRLEMTGYVPPAPASVTAFAGNNCNLLSWPVTPGATSYNILCSTTSGSGYTSIATNVTGPVCGSGPANATYVDSTAVNGTTYYYVVQSVNPTGVSANSPQSTGVAPSSAVTTSAPAAPTGLVVTPGNGQVALGWTAQAGANYYTIQRSTLVSDGGGAYNTLGTITLSNTVTGTTFTDTTPTNGSTYTYAISAANAGGSGTVATSAMAVPVPPAPTAAPANLTVATTGTQATLSWTAVSGAIGYVIERATSPGGPFTYVMTVTETTYTDTGLTANTNYYYEVEAVNAGGASANATANNTTPPAAPTNLTALAGSEQVTLTWTASAGAASYVVERGTVTGGPYTAVGNPVTSGTSYTDTGLTNGTTYYYVVAASANTNGSNLGATSAEVNATPEAQSGPETWAGADATNGDWSNGDNWLGGVPPGATSGTANTNLATFNTAISAHGWGNGATPVIIDQATQNIGGISFDTSAGNYTIGTANGNPLLLTSGGTTQILSTLSATNAQEKINAPLVLEGGYTFANNSANGTGATDGTLDFGGGITAAGGVTATLTLSGSNTNANTISSVIGNGTSGANLSLTQSGTGTWILTGANTYSGSTTVNGGVLQLNPGGGVNGTAASVVAGQLLVNGGTLTAGASSDVGATSTLTVASGSATFNAGLTDNAANANNSSVISVMGGTLTASTITVGRSSTSLGTTPETISDSSGLIVSGGAVNVTGALSAGAGNTNSSASAHMSGGTITVGGITTITDNNAGRFSILFVAGGTFADNDTSGVGIKIGGVFANTVDELYVDGGTVNTPAITFGDGTQTAGTDLLHLNAGALYVGTGGINKGETSGTTANTITLSAGTLGALGNWSSSLPITLGGATIQTANAGNAPFTITLSGVLSGATLAEAGAGTLVLSGANTYTGGTTIGGGTVEFNTTTSMPATGTVAVSNGATLAVMLGSGTGQFTNSTSTTTNGSIGTLLAGKGGQGAAVTWSAGASLGLDTTNASGGFTYAGNITTAGLGLAKLGTGTLTLTGANTYTGATTVSAGELIITGNLTSSSSLSVASGATLDLTGATVSTPGAITNDGTLILGAGVTLSSTGTYTNNGILNLTNDPTYTLPANFVNNGTVLTAPSPATDTPLLPPWAWLFLIIGLFLAGSAPFHRKGLSRAAKIPAS